MVPQGAHRANLIICRLPSNTEPIIFDQLCLIRSKEQLQLSKANAFTVSTRLQLSESGYRARAHTLTYTYKYCQNIYI